MNKFLIIMGIITLASCQSPVETEETLSTEVEVEVVTLSEEVDTTDTDTTFVVE